jgi:hypothetical protein
MYHLGVNDAGDFDQLSLAGVDFGEDYDQDHKIKPNNLEGDYSMYGQDNNQLGYAYQMGVLPEGMGNDFNQLGVVPSGMGHSHYHQMGVVPSGLGHYDQLGQGFMDTLNRPLTTVAGINVTPLGLGLAAGALWFMKQQGMLKFMGL